MSRCIKPLNIPAAKTIGVLIAAGAALSWPAVWNGFPLIYDGDSIDYLYQGGPVLRALVLGDFSKHYGSRSLLYGLGIFPFHWRTNAWPVVGLHAALTAYVLFLVTRSVLSGRSHRAFLMALGPLCLLSSASWYVSFVMPDILGPVLFLSFYLLAYCWSDLSRTERYALVLISLWAATSHGSHFLVGAALSVFMLLVLLAQRQPIGDAARASGRLATIIVAAAIVQLAFYSYLFGKPSLFGPQYPFLMVRIVTDPPGKLYLKHRCATPDLAICRYVDELPDEPLEFFWADGGVWHRSTPAVREQLRREGKSIVLGTIRKYPVEQLRVSLRHFRDQLVTFGLDHFARTSRYLKEQIGRVLNGERREYLQSRQVRGNLREDLFSRIHRYLVVASVIVLIVFLLFLRRRLTSRLTGLTAVVLFVLTANAAVTGIVSTVAPRLQDRVIWLLPFLAVLLVMSLLPGGAARNAERTSRIDVTIRNGSGPQRRASGTSTRGPARDYSRGTRPIR